MERAVAVAIEVLAWAGLQRRGDEGVGTAEVGLRDGPVVETAVVADVEEDEVRRCFFLRRAEGRFVVK